MMVKRQKKLLMKPLKYSVKKYFDVVDSHQSGGTLLFWMLDGIAHNFVDSKDALDILKRLTKIEKKLIEAEEIPAYFKVYVLKKNWEMGVLKIL